MQITFEANTALLEDRLHVLARQIRVAPGVVIKEEARGITRQIIALTPPRNLAQGRAAVKRDVGRVFSALKPEAIRWPALRAAVTKRDDALVGLLLGKAKSRVAFTSSPADLKNAHLRRRTRFGRVGGKAELATYAREGARYLRDVQSRVGWARGAWVAGLIASGDRAPKWYSRHADKSGTARAHFGENPFFTATARAIKIPNYQRLVNAAVATRERITQRKIDRIIAGKAVNLGFMVVEART